MNAHSSLTNSSLHSPSASFTQHLEASHQTMRKPSPTSNSHLQMAIRMHAASSAGLAPFRHFHRAESEQMPKPSIGDETVDALMRDVASWPLTSKSDVRLNVGSQWISGRAPDIRNRRS